MNSKDNKCIQKCVDNWFEYSEGKKLPMWCELPEFDVYMDQVIMLMEKYVGGFFNDSDEPFLTPTMINNYVKHKIMPAPNKKKYSREHLAYLIILCMLKPVMSIQEICNLIKCKLQNKNIDEVLDWFSQIHNELYTKVTSDTKNLLLSNKEKVEIEDISNLAFSFGIEAAITKNISATFIKQMFKTNENASLTESKTSKVKIEE